MSYPEQFIPIFARNCAVKRIEVGVARPFLENCHRYGWSKCRYCYGLFIERTGGGTSDRAGHGDFPPGTLVAVATFSNARRWKKGDRIVSSYEWVRYSSLKEIRVLGGMSKMLQAFVDEIHPDDVMSYAPAQDSSGNSGEVYLSLGFTLEGEKEFDGGKSLKFRKRFDD